MIEYWKTNTNKQPIYHPGSQAIEKQWEHLGASKLYKHKHIIYGNIILQMKVVSVNCRMLLISHTVLSLTQTVRYFIRVRMYLHAGICGYLENQNGFKIWYHKMHNIYHRVNMNQEAKGRTCDFTHCSFYVN